MLWQIFTRPQFQNLSLKYCFLSWSRVLENVDYYPKITTTTKLFNLFYACQWKIPSLIFFVRLKMHCLLRKPKKIFKLSTTKNIFKGPCDSLKMKTLPRTRRNLPIVWHWTQSNIPDRLRKTQKRLNHSTLLSLYWPAHWLHGTLDSVTESPPHNGTVSRD